MAQKLLDWFDDNIAPIAGTIISGAVVLAVFVFAIFLAPALKAIELDSAAIKVVYVQDMPCIVVESGITCDWTRFNPQEGR